MHRDETVLAVGMIEAARRLGLSARTVATLVSRRELPSRKVGRRRIIPVVAQSFRRADHLTFGLSLQAAWRELPQGEPCLQNEGPRLAVQGNLGPEQNR